MGKIIDSIHQTLEKGGTTVSLEFFPAKTEEGMSNLLSRIEVSQLSSSIMITDDSQSWLNHNARVGLLCW